MKLNAHIGKPPRLALIVVFALLAIVIQTELTACYKTEIEITPEPPIEGTTKKSGWFGGFKNLFRGSDSTTTTSTTTTTTTPLPLPARGAPVVQQPTPSLSGGAHVAGGGSNTGSSIAKKPPPLVIPHAPLMPLGPRPDTPSTLSGGSPQQAPQWPLAGVATGTVTSTTSTTTTRAPPLISQQLPQTHQNGLRPGGAAATPNLPPGFAPYRPPKVQPSGFDLSYGGGADGHGKPNGGRPGAGLAPLTTPTTSTTTTTTTTPRSPLSRPGQQPVAQPGANNIDLRFDAGPKSPTPSSHRPQTPKDDYPTLPSPRRPSIKEEFPALPTPKTPGSSSTPGSPLRPSSPSAWQSPLPTPATTPVAPSSGAVHPPVHPPVRPASPTPAGTGTNGGNNGGGSGGNHGVSFVPHTPGRTTTVRPGFQSTGNSLATDDEIRQLTEQLYTKETNSQLNLINVNLQGRTRSIDSGDEAPQPLLNIDAKVFDSSTIAKLKLLFNNYEEDTLTNEHVTPNERKEENDFLDAVMATGVMRQAMLFLQQKGIVSPDPKTHRDLVKELWFTQYSRGQGKIGSSGFEHVFVHEVKNGTIIGFHNWVYVHEQEQAGKFDYMGYMNHLDLGTKGKVLKMRFSYNGLNKPVDTMFIGTSPELELALYTVCFQLRPDRSCPVSLNNSKFSVVTYSWRYRGKSLIGSAYPEI